MSPVDRQDVDALRDSIEAFGKEHRGRPFGVLREVGVQAALKRLTDDRLEGHSTVDAQLVDRNHASIMIRGTEHPRVVNMERVRLESNILLPPAAGNGTEIPGEERAGRQDRTDLLLYRRHGVQLVRYGNGPGDIVYRSFAESVLAAVEIKANPSHTA